MTTLTYHEAPWPHYRLDPALPADVFRGIPRVPSVCFHPLRHQDSTRRLFLDLHPKALRFGHGLPAHYLPPIMRAAGTLMRVFLDDVEGHWRGLLVRDLPGYRIRPHTDAADKVFSVILYLSGDHGTRLYRWEPSGCALVPKFELSGAPNTALAFERTQDSYHGVEPTERERNLLILTAYREPHWRDVYPQRADEPFRPGPINPYDIPWRTP